MLYKRFFVLLFVTMMMSFLSSLSVNAQFEIDLCPPVCPEDIFRAPPENLSQVGGPGGQALYAASRDYLTLVNERNYDIWIAVIAQGQYESEWSLSTENGWYASGWWKLPAYDSIDILFNHTSANNIYLYAEKAGGGAILNRFDSDGIERDGVMYNVIHSSIFEDNAEDQISECIYLSDCDPDTDVESVWFRRLDTNFTATYNSQSYTFTFWD